MAKKSDAAADRRGADRQLDLPFPPQIVRISNALCRARYGPESVFEPRIVAAIATRVKPGDDDALVYDIPVVEILGHGYSGADLTRLRDAAKKLVSRVVVLQEEGSKSWDVMPMIARCTYDDNTGILTCRIEDVIRPHFLWYNENILQYTRYNYIDFLKLPSIYSQRFFQYLKSWQSEPEHTESLDILHAMLCTPKTYRANFAFFNRYVLAPAQKHIHKNTTMRFAWEPVKKGKKVTAIRFIFSGRRVAESKLEAARIAGGKAVAASTRYIAAYKEAQSCAKEKKGICTARDRMKRVCDTCAEWKFLHQYAPATEHYKTQISQQGQRVLEPFES